MSSKSKDLCEFDIQNAMFSRLFTGHIHICPNYTPRGWFECDMFAVTMAGYFVEFEIKISAADFRNDVKKSRDKRTIHDFCAHRLPEMERKHDLLAAKDKRGPSRFFYVLPENVVASSDVPEWAGIWRASRFGERVVLGMERKAPQLHKEMVDASVVHHLQKIFYYRFWNERRRKRGGSAISTTTIKEPEQ